MKGRESGMPEKEVWETFFQPAAILRTLGLNERMRDVADFGCGYGTFTIAIAKVVLGKVYAIDIDPQMIKLTVEAASKQRLNNIEVILRDFMSDGTGLRDASMDYVMLFNILHVERPQRLLREAWRILSNEGKLGMIHWNYDPATPRGPSMEIRPKPEQCVAWAEAAGFSHPKQHDLKPYHYGIVMRK